MNPIPEMAAWHDECESHARQELDADEFQTAWAQGDALSLNEAAAFALDGHGHPAELRPETWSTGRVGPTGVS